MFPEENGSPAIYSCPPGVKCHLICSSARTVREKKGKYNIRWKKTSTFYPPWAVDKSENFSMK